MLPSRCSAPFSALLLVSLIWGSCACLSYTQKNRALRQAALRGDLPRAFTLLQEASHLDAQGKNRLLYYLEKATILHHLQSYSKAEKAYHTATHLMKKLYTQSISQGALSFVINDSTMDYAGEPYELIAVHMMLALLYLQQNDLQRARVEARRVSTRLKELARDQDRDHGGVYHRDAFALYLAGVIYEALREYDSAAVDYENALETYELGYPGADIPDSLVRSLYVVSQASGRKERAAQLKEKYPRILQGPHKNLRSGLWVVAYGYPVTPKVSKSFIFATGSTIIRYSWPSLPPFSSRLPHYDVRLHQKPYPLEIAQDMDAIARSVLEERRLSLTLKNISRLTAKEYLTHRLAETHPLLGILGKIAAAFSETADVRSWSLLPSKFAVQRIHLPPGSYALSYLRRSVPATLSFSIKDSEDLSIAVLDYASPAVPPQRISSLLKLKESSTKLAALIAALRQSSAAPL